MHLSAALFSQMADVKLVEVPYKGSGPAALDVLAGNVPLAVVDLPSALQQIKAGKLVAYAVTSPQRLPQLPDVPTVSEAGPAGLRLDRLVRRGRARRHAGRRSCSASTPRSPRR